MTTVINNPTPNPIEKTITVERTTTDSGAGWAVAVIVLIAVVIGGAYVWAHYYRTAAAPSGGTNINVTLPASGNQSGTTNTPPANPAPTY